MTPTMIEPKMEERNADVAWIPSGQAPVPSGIAVACQSERSQHKNRSTAMKMLKAKLYELEFNKRNAAAKVLEDSKSDVSWGNQIRSYVLDQSRIKDLRTGVEVGNTTAVLDGALDQFMQASLKQGL